MSDPSPPPDLPPAKAPLSLGRRIAAAIGIFIMLFSGGCSISMLIGEYYLASVRWSIFEYVVVAGGLPFVIGLIILLAALGRPPRLWLVAAVSVGVALAGAAGFIVAGLIVMNSGEAFFLLLTGVSFAIVQLILWLDRRIGW